MNIYLYIGLGLVGLVAIYLVIGGLIASLFIKGADMFDGVDLGGED